MRTINDLTHDYGDEGMTSKMIHHANKTETDWMKIMRYHKPYQNDIGEIKEKLANEGRFSK